MSWEPWTKAVVVNREIKDDNELIDKAVESDDQSTIYRNKLVSEAEQCLLLVDEALPNEL